ncbi:MAG: dolichyl-phosphate beta-glucosyltransferase [Myxococcota bacterium]|nr:dolichyl-phosphate beta-glucosyltransferase [Myxococcota bacterium]
MTATPVELSVVVPAYREAERISDSLRQIDAYLAARASGAEIVVVDDGSSDDTANVVREIARGLVTPLRLLISQRNRGKGHALKLGFAASRGARILFTDADLSTPIECADAVLAPLDEGFDLVLGSRKMEGARLEIRQPWLRESLGKVFTRIARVLIADVSDVTCGFKAFRGDVGRDLFSRVRIDDWSFDAELLLISVHRGCRFTEVPVAWQDRAGTKVRLVRDILSTLAGLATMRIHLALGRYAEPAPHGAFSSEELGASAGVADGTVG